jgi:LuxR family maltose regulon positive regulatory protein
MDRGVNEARDRLSQLEEAMSRIHRRNVCVDVLALEALTYRKLGDESTGLEKLRAALDMAEPGGWIRNFVDLGAPMRELLGRLRQADPGHAYAQQVLTACIDEAKRHGAASPDADECSDLSDQPLGILTQREIELLPLIEDGLSNKQISARLYISEVTVKTHLQNIYRKLDAKGRIEALKKSRELGIIAHT